MHSGRQTIQLSTDLALWRVSYVTLH